MNLSVLRTRGAGILVLYDVGQYFSPARVFQITICPLKIE